MTAKITRITTDMREAFRALTVGRNLMSHVFYGFMDEKQAEDIRANKDRTEKELRRIIKESTRPLQNTLTML